MRLTPKGRQTLDRYQQVLAAVEDRWEKRFGPDTIGGLRDALQGIVDQRDGDHPRLSEGLVPYPEGWRAERPYLASTNRMVTDPTGHLPHHPMVLHRGGWPDGS